MSVQDHYYCPICGNNNAINATYAEDIGVVEKYTCCPDCGYCYSMCYSDPVEYFDDKTTVFSLDYSNTTVKNNIEKHKDIRAKLKDIDHIPVNPDWMDYI